MILSSAENCRRALALTIPGTEDEDRDIGRLSELPTYFPAIHYGKHQVKDDEDRLMTLGQFQCLVTIIGNERLKPFPLKIERYERCGFLIVFHN